MQETILRFLSGMESPILDIIVQACTILGEELFIIPIIAWIYWNHSREKGYKIAGVLLLSVCINSLLKLIFRSPRPFTLMDDISGKRLHTATGYSFPSGHSQTAASFYTSCLILVPGERRKRLAPLLGVLILLVGFSRLYLGVHWPIDVICGIALGMLFALPALLDTRPFFQALVPIALSLFIISLFTAFLDKGLSWNLKGVDTAVKLSALLLALASLKPRCDRDLPFIELAPWSIRFSRFFIGISGVLLIQAGMKQLPGFILLDALRYFTIGAWIAYLLPLAGMKFGLFATSRV